MKAFKVKFNVQSILLLSIVGLSLSACGETRIGNAATDQTSDEIESQFEIDMDASRRSLSGEADSSSTVNRCYIRVNRCIDRPHYSNKLVRIYLNAQNPDRRRDECHAKVHDVDGRDDFRDLCASPDQATAFFSHPTDASKNFTHVIQPNPADVQAAGGQAPWLNPPVAGPVQNWNFVAQYNGLACKGIVPEHASIQRFWTLTQPSGTSASMMAFTGDTGPVQRIVVSIATARLRRTDGVVDITIRGRARQMINPSPGRRPFILDQVKQIMPDGSLRDAPPDYRILECESI